MKIKCVKAECPICNLIGSIQLFMNRSGEVRYARTRHYSHIDKDSKKPQFTYCKIEDLEALKTLLLQQGISLNNTVTAGQVGQDMGFATIDPQLRGCAPVSPTKPRASSSVRIEHQPPKFPSYIDPQKYREYLNANFCHSYAKQQYNNTIKHHDCLETPQKLSQIPASNRANILKAMVNIAKFLGKYEDYKARLKQYGIKWVNGEDSFSSFLRIINNNHSSLGEWYKTAQSILRDNERLWLRFNLLTGLRKEESITSFNLIIQLNAEGKLYEYYNSELGILEHFKYPKLFLRQTKNCYISIVTKDLIEQIVASQPVSYSAIRKRLTRNNHKLRIKEQRSCNSTYLRTHGILAEYVDLIQGRIPKTVFARHYLKVEDLKKLASQVIDCSETIENCLLT